MSLKQILVKNKILKNFSVLTASNAATQFLLIFTSIKIARSLDPVLFGTYNLLQLHVSIFVVIASFGVRNILIRSIARNKDIIKKLFFFALIIRAAGVLLAFILFGIYFMLEKQYDNLLFYFVLQCILSSVLFDLFESVAFGLEKMEFSGIINLLSAFCWLLTILLIPKNQLSLSLIFGLFVLFNTIKTLLYFFSIYKVEFIKNFKSEQFSKDRFIEFSKECFPYYYLALFTLLSNQIPILFLEYRSGVAQIGYFNIASKILMPINLVLTTALAAIFPNLSRLFILNYPQFIKNVKIVFILITVFCIAGAFGVTLFRKEVIFLLYGLKYSSSGLVLGYQCWYIAIYSLVCLIGTILGAINRQKELSYLSIVSTLIQVPILWYGSKYGAQYLSAAFLVATCITLLLHIFMINRYLKNELNVSFYLKILIPFILFYCFSLFLPTTLSFVKKAGIFITISIVGVYFIFNKYKYNLKSLFAKREVQ